jgi:HK97 family phage major capsid protein
VARRYVTNDARLHGITNRAGNPAGGQMTADEAVAALTDPASAAKVFGSAAEAAKFRAQYAQRMGNSADIDAQIAEQVQLQVAGLLRANGGQGSPLDVSNRSAAKVAMRSAQAPGASLNGLFGSLGEIVQAGAMRNPGADADAALSKIANAFSESVPADGGFLVPEEYRSDIATVALEQSIVRPRASVMPMSSLRLIVPTNDSTSNVASTFGGVTTYWTEEGAALVASSAKFGRVVLDAKKLTAYAEVPNELMSDSPALDAWLRMAFGQAIAFGEDGAFLAGSGVGEPLGMYNASALISVTRDTAARITWTDVVNMFARMLPSSLGRAVWVASPGCIPDLLHMQIQGKETANGATVTGGPALIGYGAGGQAAPTSILGRPLIFTEKAPDLASAKALSFVDFGYYLVGDRQQASLQVSQDYKFGNDLAAIRIIERVDGRPLLQSAITPANGGSTLSPYVGIG